MAQLNGFALFKTLIYSKGNPNYFVIKSIQLNKFSFKNNNLGPYSNDKVVIKVLTLTKVFIKDSWTIQTLGTTSPCVQWRPGFGEITVSSINI